MKMVLWKIGWSKTEEIILMLSVHSRCFLAEFLLIFRYCLARSIQESCKKRLNHQEMSDLTESGRFCLKFKTLARFLQIMSDMLHFCKDLARNIWQFDWGNWVCLEKSVSAFQAAVLNIAASSDADVVVCKTEPHDDFVSQVCWDYEGERLFTFGKEQLLRSFDARTGKLIQKVNPLRNYMVVSSTVFLRTQAATCTFFSVVISRPIFEEIR